MKKPTFDNDGYITDESLDEIKNWKITDQNELDNFVNYVYDAYNFNYGSMQIVANYDKLSCFNFAPFPAIVVTTGGWSGNEVVVQHMNQNLFVLAFMLVAEIRGGLFVYHHKAFNLK